MSGPSGSPKAVIAAKPRAKLRALKIITWVIVILAVLAILPAIAATAGTPACSNCHTDEVKAQKQTAHANVDCTACHEGSTGITRWAFRQTVVYGMVLKIVPLSGTQAGIPDASCVACHESGTIGTGAKGLVTANGLHIEHADCSKGQTCVSCHGDSGHTVPDEMTTRYTMDACVSCHSENQIDSSDCKSCHVDSPEKKSLDKAGISASTFSVTHGKDWKQMHGTGDQTTCSACHESKDCARCHGPLVPHDRYIVSMHGKAAADPDNKCGTCHTDEKFCSDCHGVEMPHPSNYLKVHAADAAGAGEKKCYNCHAKSDCTTCHDAHVHPGGATL